MAGLVAAARSRLAPGGLARDTVWALVIEAVLLFSSVLSFALLGRSLGAAAYGDYVAIFAVAAPLGALAVAGSSLALLHHSVRDHEPLAEVTRSSVTIGVVAGTVLGAIAVPLTAFVVDSVAMWVVACFVAAEFLLAPLINLSAAVIQAAEGYGAAAKTRIAPILTRTALLAVLAGFGVLSVETLAPAYLLMTIVIAAVLMHRSGRRCGVRFGPGRAPRRIVNSAVFYSVGITSMSLQNDGDKVVLSASGAGADSGLYAAAYKIVQFGMVPVGGLINSSHNRFLENSEGVENEHIRRTFRYTLVTVGYGAIFGAFMFVAAPTLTKLLGPEYSEATPVLRALSPFIIARGVATFAINGLLGLGRTGVRTVLLIANAVLAVGLYLLLIPEYSWKGAVVATLVSEAVLAVATWTCLIYYQRKHNATVRAARGELVDVSMALGESGPTGDPGEAMIY
jgi:O-antigen/teichoic acid export membrane protein